MNWASSNVGAKLIDFSSELDECPASNVLDDNLSTIWLSEEGFPQWLCISLAGLKNTNSLVIRTIGWNCWHSYITNPKIVSMHVSNDGSKFKMWDSFVVSELSRGTELFSCAPVDCSMYPFIALEVTQTFGGSQTYMNRVFLYSDEVTASPSSSKDETHSISDSDSEFMRNQANNISELSGKTSEIEQPGRVSHDTEQVVDQLQNALGLRSSPDDSYYSDDPENDLLDLSAVHGDRGQAGWTNTEASPATVAGRLASLEHTVQALEQTVLDHSKTNGTPGVSFARSSTSQSRTHSRSQSPATSLVSDRHRIEKNHNRGDRIDENRVGIVTERLGAIEEKFSRLLDALATSPSIQTSVPERPLPPPPPPPPRSVVSTAHSSNSLTSSFPHSKSSISQSHATSLHPSSHVPQRLYQSATNVSTATISTKSPSLIAERPPPPPSLARSSKEATEQAMEHVVRSVETMMHRVLAQHEHNSKNQQRISSIDSSINSSSVLERADSTYHEVPQQHRDRVDVGPSQASNRNSTNDVQNDWHYRRPSERPNSNDISSDGDNYIATGRSSRGGRSVGDYISSKASKLLLEKKRRQREEMARNEQKLSSQPELPSTARNRRIPHNRFRAAMQERAHSRIRSDSNTSIYNSSSSDTDAVHHGQERSRRKDKNLDDLESHNILERSIFELLKSKYGLGTPTEDPPTSSINASLPPSLPMRVPVQPTPSDGAVVDWAEYVKSRVTSGRNGSPLRYVTGNTMENIDVMPRARQSLRDGRREREHQQAASVDRSVSPLRAVPHFTAMEALSGCTHPATAEATHHSTAALPAWCEQDPEMAELVRALHEKVYQRTIKEAQYDMMLLVEKS